MTQTESIKNLAKALAVFHVKIGKIAKKDNNPFFKSKYAGLPSILEAIQIPLEESGLIFTQFPSENGLCTTLIHVDTGEYMQSSFIMNPIKNDPQSWGSAITYNRRYALVSILGLNVDNDDDGNEASKPQPPISASELDTKVWLNKNTPQWEEAKKYLIGGGNIEAIKTKYKIRKENETELLTITNI